MGEYAIMSGKKCQVLPMELNPLSLPDEESQLVRVLVVDDTPDVLRDLHQLLELSGVVKVVAEARDGAEAVALAATLAPDVVIMDLVMPGMDGYEATRQIKIHHLARRVVVLSVHAGPEEIEQARRAGADSFIIKGSSYEILLKAILGQDKTFNTSQ
jgi:DNA-binding NarL/FixJ family response regulator